jgi:hypothetical protein
LVVLAQSGYLIAEESPTRGSLRSLRSSLEVTEVWWSRRTTPGAAPGGITAGCQGRCVCRVVGTPCGEARTWAHCDIREEFTADLRSVSTKTAVSPGPFRSVGGPNARRPTPAACAGRLYRPPVRATCRSHAYGPPLPAPNTALRQRPTVPKFHPGPAPLSAALTAAREHPCSVRDRLPE